MILHFFKNNTPVSYILLPLFALALWVLTFVSPLLFSAQPTMPFFELANPVLKMPLLSTFIAFLLIISEAFLLNFIVNENEIITKQSYLPALFYVSFMSTHFTMQVLHPLIFSNFFVLLALYRLLSSYRKDNAFSNAFDSGIFLSIASLFYFPNIVFFPLLGIGLILIRPFSWREWLISFFGVIVPYFFVLVYFFWNDRLDTFWNDLLFYFHFNFHAQNPVSNSSYFIFSIGSLMILLSFAKLLNDLSFGSQKSKKGIRLLLWFSLFSCISLLFTPEFSAKYFSSLAIPFSVFCSNYFLTLKKTWWGEFLFILFISAIIFGQVCNFL